MDSKSQLRAAYIAIIGDVRVLAEQRKKLPRKHIVTAEYSVDNDLDVYRLSAQLSVINRDNIGSIGELEGRISKVRSEYEKQRLEINAYIEEHNRMVSLWSRRRNTLRCRRKRSCQRPRKLDLTFVVRL